MRKVCVLAAFAAVMLAAAAPAPAQDISDNVGITLPSFDVRLSLGFNYDLLRSLTDVSFNYPAGYIGLNLPLAPGGSILSKEMVDDLFKNDDMFRTPDNFKPTAKAGQSANATIRVDVPMLNGVGSFGYTQNFNFDFSTAFGGASVINAYIPLNELEGADGGVDGFLSLRGALRMPLTINMGWETMTFGYAYRVNNSDDLVFALNLHRHLFSMDVRMRADIDLLGHINVKTENSVEIDGTTFNITEAFNADLINFSSDRCNGSAQARYRAEAWSPSLGVRWGRLRLDSRFGLDVKAKGSARGGFVVPQIVNLESPGKDDLFEEGRFAGLGDSLARNPEYLSELMTSAIPREVDSVYYSIDETMRWKMPQGHTITFDIVRNMFSISYTKTFGEINLKITDILRSTNVESTESGWLDPNNEILEVDLGVKVDHILMLHFQTARFFANLGIAGLEAREGDNYALRDMESLKSLRLGGVTMALPVLSSGFTLGTRLQLQLEANILPLPALKTGVNYYF